MISSIELAGICGVSQGTVDRALHNRPGINPRTREMVLKTAEAHGYRPHPGALEILGKTSKTVACVMSSINNVFFMDMLNVIRTGIRCLGRRFVITAADNAAELIESLRDFSARRCPAAVIVPPEDNILIPPDITGNMSVISLLSPCRGGNIRFISPDEESTGKRAVDYLVSAGHRHIMHLTCSRKAYAVSARIRGYRYAMKEHGLKPVVRVEKNVADLAGLVRREKVSAIFCHNDWLALMAIRKLAECGVRVPEHVSVLGVDNSPTFTALYPGLTTLEYPSEWLRDQTVRIFSGKKPLKKSPCFNLVERQTVARI